MSATRRTITVACSLVAATATARADDVLLSAGAYGTYLWSERLNVGGGGLEASVMRYRGSVMRDPFRFGYGAVAQLGVLAHDENVAVTGLLGAQVALGMVGCELGVYGHSGFTGRDANLGLHVAPYLSLGVVYVGLVARVPWLADASGSIAPEFGLTFGVKGPFTLSGSPMAFDMSFGRGRPLWCDGAPVVATVSHDDAWSAPLAPAVAHLDAATRAALARAWCDDALAEHASIGAFTRVSMQLLAVGAPPELVAGAHEAALDEVRHARACFALAGAYGACDVGAGPMAVDAIRAAACDRVALAVESLVEGCVGEGAAAEMAREGAACCDDPAVRGALEAIARDEAAHAALAWRIVGWCLDTGGDDVVDALLDAMGAVARPRGDAPARGDVDAVAWAAAGRLTGAQAAAVYARVVDAARAALGAMPAVASRSVTAVLRAAPPRRRRGREAPGQKKLRAEVVSTIA